MRTVSNCTEGRLLGEHSAQLTKALVVLSFLTPLQLHSVAGTDIFLRGIFLAK